MYIALDHPSLTSSGFAAYRHFICRSSGGCEMWETSSKHPAPLALRTDNIEFNDLFICTHLFNSHNLQVILENI